MLLQPTGYTTMLRRPQLLAFSTIGLLVGLGSSAALYGGCSPSAGNGNDAGMDAAPCPPGDTVCGAACDPTTFKTTDCYTGPAGTNSQGVCQTGKRSCNADGTQSACVGEVTPSPEICNYADDDCNGIIDDVQAIVEAGTLFNCNSPACLPDYPDAAITCWGADFGICGAGNLACKGGPKGGSPTGCVEYLHTGAPEICNGIDDDCNGLIDDGLTSDGPCQLGNGHKWTEFPDADLTNLGTTSDGGHLAVVVGQCADGGQLACTDNECNEHFCADAGDTCAPLAPSAEVCNGLDDNCNGQVDEHACKNNPYGYRWCCPTYYYPPYDDGCEPSNYTGTCVMQP